MSMEFSTDELKTLLSALQEAESSLTNKVDDGFYLGHTKEEQKEIKETIKDYAQVQRLINGRIKKERQCLQ